MITWERTGTRSYGRIAALLVTVLLVATMLTWAYLSMRSVMDVGGACADGGPYVSAQPCPDGAGFIGIAIPVLLLATFAGSALAIALSAPTLILPMWGFLFGSLGWNFLEYGFGDDGPVAGWIVCGVVLWLMALPAFIVMFTVDSLPGTPGPSGRERLAGSGTWWAVYAALGVAGVTLGAWSFYSWR